MPGVKRLALAGVAVALVVLAISAGAVADPPTVTIQAPSTVEATGPAGGIVVYTVTVIDDFPNPGLVCSPQSGTTFALGQTVITCTATDVTATAIPESTTASATVTVVDTTPPTLSLPGSFAVEATGPGGATVVYSASANDLVDGSIAPSCDHPSGGTFPIGSTTVTCTATDSSSNTASGSFDVTVRDTTPPVVTVPASITVEATGPSGATVSYSGASATDAVSGSLTPTCLPGSGGTFPLGTTAVKCTATDGAGNTGSNSFNVTVQDTTPPVLTVPGPITLEATGPGGAAVTYSGVSATDTVSGNLTPSCVPASGSIFPVGTTTVDCTATDGSGNSVSKSFTVTVRDTTPPILTLPAPITAEATGPGVLRSPTRRRRLTRSAAA